MKHIADDYLYDKFLNDSSSWRGSWQR